MGLDFGAKALGAMAIPMSSGNTKRQLMCMEDFGATAFACTPSYAMYLAEAAQEARQLMDQAGQACEKMKESARLRLDQAAQLIVEKVVNR